MSEFMHSAIGVLESLALYLAIVTVVAIFLIRNGQRVLACWWFQPFGVGVCIFVLVLLLDAPQMPDMFFGMAMGYSGGKEDWHLWHALGLGASATWLALEAWYWTRAGLLSLLRVSDALWINDCRARSLGKPGIIDAPATRPDWAVVWAARITMFMAGGAAGAPLLLFLYGKLPYDEFRVILVPVVSGVVTLILACLAVTHRHRIISANVLALFDVLPTSRLWHCHTFGLFAAAPFGWVAGALVFTLSIVAWVIVARNPGFVESSLHAPTAAILALSFLIAPLTVLLAVGRDLVKVFLMGIGKCYAVIVNGYRKMRGKSGVTLNFSNIDPIARTVGLLLLLAWVTFNDAFNDTSQTSDQQYSIRQASKHSESLVENRDSLSDAVAAWQATLEGEGETGDLPLIIVAAEGGASRSAAWVLSVLRMLDEATNGQFGRHIFAFSAVSGGSLGAATYVEMLKSGNWTSQADLWKDDRIKKGMRELARGDLLAASIATFFLNDAVSQVLGFWEADDRGVALERAFERHWQWDIGFRIPKENAEAGFLAIRHGRNRPLPNLLLNGTDVRTGRRLITSSIAFTPGDDLFAAADDFLSRLNYDVPMSTAVTNSARFPFISPAGRFGRRDSKEDSRGQIVDGGVFENYGARTAWELARGIDHLKKTKHVVPIVVLVSNDADGASSKADSERYASLKGLRPIEDTAISCQPRRGEAPKQANLGREAEGRERAGGGAILPDALTSVIGLYSSRGAHGRSELFTLRREFCTGDRFFHIALPAPIVERRQAAPMNWVLNTEVCRFLFGDALQVDFNVQEVQRLVQKLQDFGLNVGEPHDNSAKPRRGDADDCGSLPGDG